MDLNPLHNIRYRSICQHIYFYLLIAQGNVKAAVDTHHDGIAVLVNTEFPEKHFAEAKNIHREVFLTNFYPSLAQPERIDQRFSAQRFHHTDEIPYLHEYEYAVLARVYKLQEKFERGLSLIVQQCDLASSSGRNGNLIHYLILQASLSYQMGAVEDGLNSLQEAIHLAKQSGYVRTFLDEGNSIKSLLEELHQRGKEQAFCQKLLKAFELTTDSAKIKLPEPLSERELEVLRLMGAGLTGPEIADQLVVSLNIIKTHSKNIYAKLGVNKRFDAIERAHKIDLI